MKTIVNLKIYDVISWTTINYNTHIAQYFKNQKQPENEIWSINRL